VGFDVGRRRYGRYRRRVYEDELVVDWRSLRIKLIRKAIEALVAMALTVIWIYIAWMIYKAVYPFPP